MYVCISVCLSVCLYVQASRGVNLFLAVLAGLVMARGDSGAIPHPHIAYRMHITPEVSQPEVPTYLALVGNSFGF